MGRHKNYLLNIMTKRTCSGYIGLNWIPYIGFILEHGEVPEDNLWDDFECNRDI